MKLENLLLPMMISFLPITLRVVLSKSLPTIVVTARNMVRKSMRKKKALRESKMKGVVVRGEAIG